MMGAEIALDVLLLLSVAWLFGVCFERLGQNAIVGYLLAGAILGPTALDRLGHHEQVEFLAELGVALLLFSIGLEFSWREIHLDLITNPDRKGAGLRLFNEPRP